MTNAEISQLVFEYLKEIKHEAYHIDYPSKIYNDGKATSIDDSIIHFRCKGVSKHWKFGMWLYTDNKDKDGNQCEPILQIFAQWDNSIDKFKPSRSDLVLDYTTWQLTTDHWCDKFYRLGNMLAMMKRHPLMCYYGYCGENPGYTSANFLWYFLKHETPYYIRRAKEILLTAIWYPYCWLKVKIANCADCVELCDIYNFEERTDGWLTTYIYEIGCRFKENATDEEMYKIVRMFKKHEYGKYDHGLSCIVGWRRFTKAGTDEVIDYEFDT